MDNTIYIYLLDEGSDCYRPTQGIPLGNYVYQILATPDYDPEDEHWQFPPGSIVRCVLEERMNHFNGKLERLLIARELVNINS